MANSSDFYQQQLEAMGDMPDFQSTIAKAYERPIIKPLVREGAALQEQYLPTIFDTFASTGTGAGDMSAAAKLAHVGRSLGRLTGKTQMNRDIQDFYKTQIADLANLEYAKWTDKEQRLKDLYSMAYQREAAARQAAYQKMQMDAINKAIEDAKIKEEADKAAMQELAMNSTAGQLGYDISTLEGFNKYRADKGLAPVSQAYFTAYSAERPDQRMLPMSRVQDLLTFNQDQSVWKNLGEYYLGLGAAPGALLWSAGRAALGNMNR